MAYSGKFLWIMHVSADPKLATVSKFAWSSSPAEGGGAYPMGSAGVWAYPLAMVYISSVTRVGVTRNGN